MKQRFSIIQGGRSEPAAAPVGGALRSAAWRVVLRRPMHLDEAEIAAWRALNGRTPLADPFADPDFLVTAAQHAPRVEGGIVFALAYAVGGGPERLAGVLPLALPHPLWGGATIALWRPALAPHPVAPVCERGTAPAVTAAVLAHLRSVRPRTELRLDAGGETRVADGPRAGAIPRAQFVAIGPRARSERVERATAPAAVRDAVERFLLAEARHAPSPLLPDPAAAATIRVVTRLLARRGLAEVELTYADGEPVSGTIRLGAAGARVVWREAGLDAAPWQGEEFPAAGPAAACGARASAGLRLVSSRG